MLNKDGKSVRRFASPDKLIEYLHSSMGSQVILRAEVPFPGEIHLETDKMFAPALAVRLTSELGLQLIQLLAVDERESAGSFRLYYVFLSDHDKLAVVVNVPVAENDGVFTSITPHIPAAHWYEREIRDCFGLEPQGHPDNSRLALHGDWPKGIFPMRREFKLATEVARTGGRFSFTGIEGEGSVQIPVGPIHAGIIEPGHFRFSAVGENIIHLEAKLFYTHRGMEKLTEGASLDRALLLAERICGACSFAHSTAFCQAVEKLSHAQIPLRARFIRTIALELERLYNHVGDVGNICAGTGFAFGTMHGARIKEALLCLNETVFGSRFLRGLNTPGGVRRDITVTNRERITAAMDFAEKEFKQLTDVLMTTESFLDRAEGTGKLEVQTAADLHAVGPAARASGINRDARRDYPYAAYRQLNFKVPVEKSGDVLARVRIRIAETFASISIIRQALELMPQGDLRSPLGSMAPYSHAIAITESPRGENVHFVMAGPAETIFRYVVRSASYCNWPVLPTTVPGNIVPDFPLINKSFELCYSCLDR